MKGLGSISIFIAVFIIGILVFSVSPFFEMRDVPFSPVSGNVESELSEVTASDADATAVSDTSSGSFENTPIEPDSTSPQGTLIRKKPLSPPGDGETSGDSSRNKDLTGDSLPDESASVLPGLSDVTDSPDYVPSPPPYPVNIQKTIDRALGSVASEYGIIDPLLEKVGRFQNHPRVEIAGKHKGYLFGLFPVQVPTRLVVIELDEHIIVEMVHTRWWARHVLFKDKKPIIE